MKISTFRILLTVSWVGAIALAVAEVLLEPTLPPELKNYVEARAEATEFQATELAAWCAYVAVLITSYVGLYCLKRYGRTLFLWTYIASFPLNLVWPTPVVLPASVAMLYGAWNFLDGFLLATVYFVPSISERFEAPDTTANPFD